MNLHGLPAAKSQITPPALAGSAAVEPNCSGVRLIVRTPRRLSHAAYAAACDRDEDARGAFKLLSRTPEFQASMPHAWNETSRILQTSGLLPRKHSACQADDVPAGVRARGDSRDERESSRSQFCSPGFFCRDCDWHVSTIHPTCSRQENRSQNLDHGNANRPMRRWMPLRSASRRLLSAAPS